MHNTTSIFALFAFKLHNFEHKGCWLLFYVFQLICVSNLSPLQSVSPMSTFWSCRVIFSSSCSYIIWATVSLDPNFLTFATRTTLNQPYLASRNHFNLIRKGSHWVPILACRILWLSCIFFPPTDYNVTSVNSRTFENETEQVCEYTRDSLTSNCKPNYLMQV